MSSHHVIQLAQILLLRSFLCGFPLGVVQARLRENGEGGVVSFLRSRHAFLAGRGRRTFRDFFVSSSLFRCFALLLGALSVSRLAFTPLRLGLAGSRLLAGTLTFDRPCPPVQVQESHDRQRHQRGPRAVPIARTAWRLSVRYSDGVAGFLSATAKPR